MKKSRKVSIKTRSTPALLSFKGQATKQTTVTIGLVRVRVGAGVRQHYEQSPELKLFINRY